MQKIVQEKLKTYEAVLKSTLHRLKIAHMFSVEKRYTKDSKYPIFVIHPTDLDFRDLV